MEIEININRKRNLSSAMDDLTERFAKKMHIDSEQKCPMCDGRKHPNNKMNNMWIKSKKVIKKIYGNSDLGKYNCIRQMRVNPFLKQYFGLRYDFYNQLTKSTLKRVVETCRRHDIPLVQQDSTIITLKDIVDELNTKNEIIIEQKPVLMCEPDSNWCYEHTCPQCRNRCKSSKKNCCFTCQTKQMDIS